MDYDESGNMTNKTYADNSTVHHQYGAIDLNRVTNKTDAAGIQTRYSYDAAAGICCPSHPAPIRNHLQL